MPNIRSQRVDSTGIEIVASDGRVFSITPSQIRANFLSQTGSTASRRTKTLQWLKDQIVAALGAEQIDIATIVADFRSSDGVPTYLETM